VVAPGATITHATPYDCEVRSRPDLAERMLYFAEHQHLRIKRTGDGEGVERGTTGEFDQTGFGL
jgi:hypothetical protein